MITPCKPKAQLGVEALALSLNNCVAVELLRSSENIVQTFTPSK
jgi:hypothetical protein